MGIVEIVALLAYLVMCIVLILFYKQQVIKEIKSFIAITPSIFLVAFIVGGLINYGTGLFMKHYILFLGITLVSIAYIYVIRYIRENTEKENALAKQKVSTTNRSNKTYKSDTTK